MTPLRVVADSSSLIGLVQIDLFEHLKDIFAEVYIPPAVFHEVVVKGLGKTGADEIASAVKAGWLLQRAARDDIAVNALLTTISRGEAEVIILTKELTADYAMIDERTARRVAALMSVKTVGVLGVIEMAIIAGIPIHKQSAIDQLKKVGFRISEQLYQKMLKM